MENPEEDFLCPSS